LHFKIEDRGGSSWCETQMNKPHLIKVPVKLQCQIMGALSMAVILAGEQQKRFEAKAGKKMPRKISQLPWLLATKRRWFDLTNT